MSVELATGRYRRRYRAALASIAVLLLSAVTSGCGAAAQEGEDNLLIASYSTPREAYDEILASYAQTGAGSDVAFDRSFGASGEVSRAVEAGLPADVVGFSLEPDMTRLVESGAVAGDWSEDEYRGMVTDSVVVIAVREGNPKDIRDWDDLTEPGVDVITPSPSTSGGAKWNFMAAYGAQRARGHSKAAALGYIDDLLENISVQDKSARESMQTFITGRGDAMLAYENEVIQAQQLGYDLDYIVPDETILIENPYAVVETSQNPREAEDFLEYLLSPEGQRAFGEKGYRPVVPEVRDEFDYREPPGLFTIEDYGGWEAVDEDFFGSEGSITGVIEERGTGG